LRPTTSPATSRVPEDARPGLLVALLLVVACASPAGPERAGQGPAGGPARTVTELYDLVTFSPGTTPDWDRVRALFVEEAVVVLRTGREEMSVFSLEGFVQDFVQFIEQANVEATGFTERILELRVNRFGDWAQVLVRFESWIPDSGRAPSEGLDSFELIRRADGWRIVSILNERPSADRPIPADLFRDRGLR